jgi:hypothetical protein
MLHTLRFFLFKMLFISFCYLFWFLYYSHFTYRVCKTLNAKFLFQKVKVVGTYQRNIWAAVRQDLVSCYGLPPGCRDQF